MTDLSIIIVNFNNCKLLDECLASIYKNTHKISLEIIVSDNASTDGSQAMIKCRFPKIKLIANKDNLGFAKANNLGLKIARARYLMLLNDDTIVKDSSLDRLVSFMDVRTKVGACGPKLLNVDGTVQRQGGILGKKFWLAKTPAPVNFVIGAALVVRREVVDQVGLMDENLFFYNEDLDWCLRIRRAGWKIYFVPEAEIIHYGGYSSQRAFIPRLFVAGLRGGLYFSRKHYGELVYNLYRLSLILALVLALPIQLTSQAKFKAYLEIIKIAWHGQIPRPVLK
ncbi:glycosyltransferase family 2 protein [Candidatus Saganbacteria bacterium]|nr:glycosyltransferase family 2 protein [Candidatus Saganbacteria bacterium]